MPDGLNKVMLIGYIGTDVDLRYTANGTALANFRMAVSRSWAGDGERREETEWFTIVAWQKLAEIVGQHLQKGRKVFVEGRLATRSWDGNDGQKHYRTEVIATSVLFLDRAPGSSDGGHSGYRPDDEIDPDDLPFS